MASNVLEQLPAEVLLHILSYLDLPELDALGRVSPVLQVIVQDPVLHKLRILVVAPSRLQHALFALEGSLRPTVADLVHWGIMRGLGIERRWRTGLYFYSAQSVRQYESSLNLQRMHVRALLSTHIKHTRAAIVSQSAALQSLHTARVLPDEESSSPALARSLLPVVRKLKWSIRRDGLARMVRDRDSYTSYAGKSAGDAVLDWFEGKGRGLWKENERIRLAICPSIRKTVRFWEALAK